MYRRGSVSQLLIVLSAPSDRGIASSNVTKGSPFSLVSDKETLFVSSEATDMLMDLNSQLVSFDSLSSEYRSSTLAWRPLSTTLVELASIDELYEWRSSLAGGSFFIGSVFCSLVSNFLGEHSISSRRVTVEVFLEGQLSFSAVCNTEKQDEKPYKNMSLLQ